MSELDSRKQTILRAVILEYVSAAEPIASEALVQKYELGVRSATVRNELAEMADLGYLEQPHTSAGRIPSDLGYRYYVDRLGTREELTDASKQQLSASSSDGDALQSLLRDTARVLSRLTHLLAVATTFRDQNVTVRTAVVSALGPQQALLVVVLSNGHVENRMVECPPGLTLQDIGMVNDVMSGAALNKSLKSLAKAKAPSFAGNPPAEKLVGQLWPILKQLTKDLTRGIMITEGEEFMFAQPEFHRNVATLNELLGHLTHSDVLYEAVAKDLPNVVTIGKENKLEPFHQLSVVRNSFFVGEDEAGIIAIIGPTRMNYDKSIPLVNFTAQALSGALTRYFG